MKKLIVSIILISLLAISAIPSGSIEGKSTLSDRTNKSVGTNPHSLALGDVNVDGHNDLVTADRYSDTLSLYIYNETLGTFDPRRSLPTGREPLGVSIGDINGDGYNDMIFTNNRDDTLGLYLYNDSSDDWEDIYVELIPGDLVRPGSVALGDLDNDETMEVVLGLANSDEIVVLKWNLTAGNFSFLQRFPVPSHPKSLDLGNITGDEYPDLAVTGSSEDIVRVYRGSESGFVLHGELNGGNSPSAVEIADLDMDGDEDLAITSYDENSIAYYYNFGGVFGEKQTLRCGDGPLDVEIGDYDNDGYNDMISISGQELKLDLFRYDIDLREFIGDGWRQSGRYPIDVEVGDIDGDGDNDVVVANMNDHDISIYTSNSYPEFTAPVGNLTLNEGSDSSELFIDLYSFFSDAEDDVNQLTFSIVDFSEGNNYTAEIKKWRYLSFDCNENVDFNGNMTITVRAQDGGGAHGDGVFTIRVLPQPDKPFILMIGNVTVYQQNPLFYLYEHSWYNATIVARDPDGDEMTYSSNVTDPLNEDLNERFHLNASTGNISFLPDKPDIGNLSVRFLVTDSTGLSSDLAVLYVIHDINDPPVIRSLDDITFEMETPHFICVEGYWLNITVNASDPEGDYIKYYLYGAPMDMIIDIDSGDIVYYPKQEDIDISRNYSIELVVKDGHGLNDTRFFTIFIIDVNMAPRLNELVMSPSSDPSAYGTGEQIKMCVNVTDPDGDVLNISWYLSDSEIPFAYGYGVDHTFLEPGNYTIRMTAKDGRGKNVTGTANVKVVLFNAPPEIVSADQCYAYVSTVYEVQYLGSDRDDDTFIWRMESNCTWLSISKDGILRGEVPGEALGEKYLVKIILEDESGGRTEREFILTIKSEKDEDGDGDTSRSDEGVLSKKMLVGLVLAVIILLGAVVAVLFRINRKKKKEREEMESETDDDFAEIVDPNRKINCASCGFELGMAEVALRDCPNCGFERW